MKYQASFWDADGVVLRSAHLFSEQLELDYGIKHELLQPFFNGVFRECSVGKADLYDELDKVIGSWGWKGTVEELTDYWFTVGTQVDQEVLGYIDQLKEKGIRCFMTTDQEKYRGEFLRAMLGSGKPFEQVFFSGELGFSKKDPRYYPFVQQHIGVTDREKILVVDDSEANIETAKSLGFAAHFYTNLEDLKSNLYV